MRRINKHIPDGLPMPVDAFLNFAISVSATLDDRHKKDEIHGDIRPENINWDSKAKICELAEPVTTEKQLSSLDRARLPYMSPEQTGRMNRRVDYRTDFYSLGVVFYELLTGNPPCISEDPLEIIHSHIAKKPLPLYELNSEVPIQISRIVMRLLEKNAEDRYQTAMGLRHDLKKCEELLAKKGAIEAFELGDSDSIGIFQIPQKLYGRKDEIESLLNSFERISAGTAEIFLVAGYSGVGKSALVHEVHKPITAKRGFFIEGKFDQYQRNIPYYAWGQAFNVLVGQLLMESDSQLSKWRVQILEAVGQNGKILTDVIPNFEQIIGPQPDVPELGGLEAQNRFNYVFQNFVGVIAQKDHPLLVFLDDLQWVDSASMNLIKILLTDPDLTYFLIIGAYRNNEVDATHLLTIGVEELKKEEINLNQLTLENLIEADVNALCADTLHTSQQESRPLAKLVYSKTAGNAFFTHQILHTLNEEKLLLFDMPTHRWHWDIEVLQEMDITDNVVELMVSKVRKLPKGTQEALQLAACIGYASEVATLAAIERKSEQAIHRHLQVAIREGILLSLGERFRFVHDRVQQAAYSLINSDQASQIHLQIGRLLLAKSQEDDDLDARILEVLAQLNRSAFLVTEGPLRIAYARLNLQGAVKARSNQAYQDALAYLDAGIDFLPEAPWTSHYRLVSDLNLERAVCLYMLGRLDDAETTLQETLSRADDVLEKLRCFSLLVSIFGSRVAYDKAIDTAWSCLDLLGNALPDPKDTEGLNRSYDEEYQQFLKLLNNKPISSLYAFPVSTNPIQIETLRLISNLADTMSINNYVASRLWIIKGINLSLQHGYGPNSGHLFSVFAVIHTIDAQDYNTAYECVELGLKLAQGKLHAQHTITKIATYSGHLVTQWVRPVEERIALSKLALQTGLESGDLTYAAYGASMSTHTQFFMGMPLDQFIKEQNQVIEIAKKCYHTFTIAWAQSTTIWAKRLIKGGIDAKVPDFDDQEFLKTWDNVSNIPYNYCIRKLQACFIFGQFDRALAMLPEIEPNAIEARAQLSTSEYHISFALSYLAAHQNLPPKQQQHYKEKFEETCELIEKSAASVPDNFWYQKRLIDAENARLEGNMPEAVQGYRDAINHTNKRGFLHFEAISCELAGKYWLSQEDEDMAGFYIKKARELFSRWGAHAKVADMTRYYSRLLETRESSLKAGDLSETNQIPLDFNTVIKASQAIAGEIFLDKLLAKMMHIVIENAGAQKGFLILKKENQWTIEAEGNIDKNKVAVLQSMSIEANDAVSASVIHYVARTQENVVLDDAINKGEFTRDPGIQQNQAKSVLCTPLINQGKGQWHSVPGK